MIVLRDEELRQFQNMWAREKEAKEKTQDELADTQIKLKGVEADLANEKQERQNEKEAAEQQIMVLDTRVAELENEKVETAKKHEATLMPSWKSIKKRSRRSRKKFAWQMQTDTKEE